MGLNTGQMSFSHVVRLIIPFTRGPYHGVMHELSEYSKKQLVMENGFNVRYLGLCQSEL
jgi:hypothetical protein